jgi:hypothetical protein
MQGAERGEAGVHVVDLDAEAEPGSVESIRQNHSFERHHSELPGSAVLA